eukprot:CCRYP_020656-RA/>CCRYP_020656-RA protein AED:0.50 eAED:0.47 QI:0/-1/0/1/-1/1/1/0/159
MKSILHTIAPALTLLFLNPSNSQNTYAPTSSTTSVASDVFMRTVAPTGSVARVPRPTPLPGSDDGTYSPTSDAAFTNFDMQAVEVNGSPVPTIAVIGSGMGGSGYVAAEGESEAGKDPAVGEAPSGVDAAAPVTNEGVWMQRGLMGTCVLGAVAWLGLF